MKMFDEYRGISYERASREAIRIIRVASESQIWTDLPERLLHLRSILQCMGDWNQPKKPTEVTASIADQLRECALSVVDGSAIFCEAPISLLERAANHIVAAEVIESYRRRWSGYTIDGSRIQGQPQIVGHTSFPQVDAQTWCGEFTPRPPIKVAE